VLVGGGGESLGAGAAVVGALVGVDAGEAVVGGGAAGVVVTDVGEWLGVGELDRFGVE